MTIEPGNYQIKNHESWTTLDQSTDGQDVVHGWQQTNEQNQHWEVQHAEEGSGAYTVRNISSGLFLHADGPYNESRLVASPTPSTWYLDQQQDGEVYIIYPGSDHVVDLAEGKSDDGTIILLWERNWQKNQQWFFERV